LAVEGLRESRLEVLEDHYIVSRRLSTLQYPSALLPARSCERTAEDNKEVGVDARLLTQILTSQCPTMFIV
jgi:hypothetical protein